jgi:hypothetical protein
MPGSPRARGPPIQSRGVKGEPGSEPRRIFIALLAVAVLASRIAARPRSFWEWDDYIFGLALHTFAPQASVPQAPFFPAFVFLGRLYRIFLPGDALALTWLGVTASSLSLLFFFLLVRDLSGPRLAVRATLLFAFLPAAWFYAGIPTSDAAGVAAALLAFWLSLRAARRSDGLGLAAAAFGFACGIRPQTAIVAAVPLALAFRVARPRTRAVGLAALLGAVLLFWIAPVVVAARGIGPLLAVFRERWLYVFTTTASFAAKASPGFVLHRWLVDPWVSPIYAAAIWALTALGFARPASAGDRRVRTLLILSFVPYLIAAGIFLDPSFSGRYVLPFLPFHAILVARGTAWLEERLPRRLPIFSAGIAIWGALLVAPAIAVLHARPSPPEEAASAIRKRTTGRPFAILYPADLYVPAELLFPGVPKFEAEQSAPSALRAKTDREVWRFGVPSLTDESDVACWPALRPFDTVGRGRYLAVAYGPWPRHTPTFGEGWYGQEVERGPDCSLRVFRWMGARSRMLFPTYPGEKDVAIELAVPLRALPEAPIVRISWNGAVLEEVRATQERLSRRFRAPAPAPTGRGEDELAISISQVFVPARTGGTDTRTLGLQLLRVRLAPE